MTTIAARRALRRQNRQIRRELRKEKKAKFNEIVEAAGKSNITINLDEAEPEFVEVFNQVWPILKPVLEYVEIVKVTGPGADKAIRAVIDLGERVSTGNASDAEQTEFIKKLDNIWPLIKSVLGIIVTFTNDKIDKVINKIIEIGDWITEDQKL
jgi:hypothetical protein